MTKKKAPPPKPKRRKLTNNPAKGLETYTTPRMLCYFRDHDRCSHVLAWIERAKPADGTPTYPIAVHILRTDDPGVSYEKRMGSEAAFLDPTDTKTTPEEFAAYLRDRLRKYGGSAAAYAALGVPKPIVEVTASPETRESHDDLYARAAQVLKTTVAALRTKYGHLNPGLQAMNLRNRIRGAGAPI